MFVKLLLLAFPLLAVAQRNCRDDLNFRWTNNRDGETFNLSCTFLTDERRRNNHCNRRVRGVLVRNMCRRSCNNCNNAPNRPYYNPPYNNPPYYNPPGSGWCEESNSDWRDSQARSCRWYNTRSRCNRAWEFQRPDGSNANSRCCSCQRGDFQPNRPSPPNRPPNRPSSPNRPPYRPPNRTSPPNRPPDRPPSNDGGNCDSGRDGCQGNNSCWTDSEGRQCSWYVTEGWNKQRCWESHQWATFSPFWRSASSTCCTCQFRASRQE